MVGGIQSTRVQHTHTHNNSLTKQTCQQTIDRNHSIYSTWHNETTHRRRNEIPLSQTFWIHWQIDRTINQSIGWTTLLPTYQRPRILCQWITHEGFHLNCPRRLTSHGRMFGKILQDRQISSSHYGFGVFGTICQIQGVGQTKCRNELSVRKSCHQDGIGENDRSYTAVCRSNCIQHEWHPSWIWSSSSINRTLSNIGTDGKCGTSSSRYWRLS